MSVIPFPQPDAYLGLGTCPKCGRTTGVLNVGRDHWGYCRLHRLAWHVGTNLFSSWREQTEADWRANARLLSAYRVVP